jgi:hypothetical protein
MSKAELEHLERDVEQARGRLAADLAVLRSPGVFSQLKNEVTSEIRGAKDEYVAKGREAAVAGAQGVLDEVKARVAANPVAALAIGAGLAWRLTRHPPIASVLLGYGLVSLFRSDPQQPGLGADYVDRAAELAGTAKERIQDWQRSRGNGDSGPSVSAIAETAKERVADWSSEATATARSVAAQTMRTAENWSESGRQALSHAMQHEDRDKYLLGAAGLALAAAVGIAYQRRSAGENGHEADGPRSHRGERLVYRDGRWTERH